MSGAVHFRRSGYLALFLMAFSGMAAAQTGNFELELNTSADVPEGCRLTFVATNNTTADLKQASYEMALFGKDNVYAMGVIFEFGELPQSKTRVVQFDLPETKCGDVTRILVNNPDKCETAKGGSDICMKGLTATSRVQSISFGL